MNRLGRRAFLALVGLLSPFGVLRGMSQRVPTAATQRISVDAFLGLSARLTGRTGLDPEIAQTYLNALLSVPAYVPLLAELSRGALSPGELTPAHVLLEREIIAAWYTGTYDIAGQRRLATHSGALMWRVLGTPAPGTCVGPTGSWSQPPRAAR